MKALGRLAAMLSLSGLMFVIINTLLNYMYLITGSVKLMQDGGVPDDYYSFKPVYMFSVTTNDKLDWKIIILMAIMAGMLLFMKLSKSFALWFRKIPDVDGSSRWATEKEIAENLCKIDSTKLEEAEKSGIILYRKKKYFFVDEATINSLIIGTTRSGKGQTFVLPMIRMLSQGKMKQSMVINDPKGELLENSYEMLINKGYKVVVLNLRDTNLSSLGEAVIKRQRGYPMKTKFEPFYKLNIPLTAISKIIQPRKINLAEKLFPFNMFEDTPLSGAINKVAQLTDGDFVACLKKGEYEKCKSYINGFSRSNSLEATEIEILVCMIKELYAKQEA